MLECIGDDSGDVGYCQLLKFVCMNEKFVIHGLKVVRLPESQEEYRDNL